MRSTLKTGLRAGFTLVEMMAVIAIITILAVFLLPKVGEALESTKVTACQRNLGKINEGLMKYHIDKGRWPRGSGVGFFTSIISDGVWEATESNTKTLTCPGVDDGFLTPGMDQIPLADWYVDKSVIDGGWSTYAGRDQRESPLRKHPASGKTVLVADDNDVDPSEETGNHRTMTNVLMGDGSVRTYDVFELRDEGVLTADESILVVGPDSPVEALRVLSLD